VPVHMGTDPATEVAAGTGLRMVRVARRCWEKAAGE
jgi:hypothetical protein